jgi:hypothetical protein
MDPINEALLAVLAGTIGDAVEAQHHLAAARALSQAGARRHRQVVEIASLVVAGSCERADGLALMHVAEFPEDAAVLASITDTGSRTE